MAGLWVIERWVRDRLCYWSPGARGRSPRDDWSESFDFAVKFADQESASMMQIHLCDSEGRTVEHAYVAAKSELGDHEA